MIRGHRRYSFIDEDWYQRGISMHTHAYSVRIKRIGTLPCWLKSSLLLVSSDSSMHVRAPWRVDTTTCEGVNMHIHAYQSCSIPRINRSLHSSYCNVFVNYLCCEESTCYVHAHNSDPSPDYSWKVALG